MPAISERPFRFLCAALTITAFAAALPTSAAVEAPLIRSAHSGSWSAAETWEGGKVPGAGARVQVRQGHVVVYDRTSAEAVRAVYIAGVLTFAPDKDTRLDVGLIRIQAGDDVSEEGFDCDAHLGEPDSAEAGPGSRDARTAHRRQAYRDDPPCLLSRAWTNNRCPAVVCCGGRMDFHGAAMNRTWIKLGATAKKGDAAVTCAEAVEGWRPGDHILVTAAQAGGKRRARAGAAAPSPRSAPSAPSTARPSRSINRWNSSIWGPATTAARSPT